MKNKVKFIGRLVYRCLSKFKILGRDTYKSIRGSAYSFDSDTTIVDIRQLTLGYINKMKVYKKGRSIGYRHSASTDKPVLYATLAALLTKHLYNYQDETIEQEVNLVLDAQSDDGLFRDPVVTCPQAETGDWWGWRHLTLHALMTLGLYGKPAKKKLAYLEQFYGDGHLLAYLGQRDWSGRVDNTSNEIQNLGVMLQYARDYQGNSRAKELMDILYEFLDSKQDPETGLYGSSFQTPSELSLACQTGYHFWLLYFYDQRPISYMERIIDNLLKTQNILGGYGTKWNSSACEDIDSIDLLVRLSRLTDYRRDDVQLSLQRALPAVLANLNGDGGWVFRRHEALTVGHRQMYSAINESNLFYTWFRTLGLSYLLSGLDNIPQNLKCKWNFKKAPGHQFL
ncbi:hypothetical protein ACFLUO_03890 [Chloroflexota bacterium]